MSELLPCPLCGGEAKRISQNRIACKACGLRTVDGQSYLKNRDLWNTRKQPKPAPIQSAEERKRIWDHFEERLSRVLRGLPSPGFDEAIHAVECVYASIDQLINSRKGEGGAPR